MKSLLPQKYHSYIYIFSLILLVAGLPLSKFLISLSQIILICNWLLEGGLKAKFSAFFKNKAALAVSSVLLLHVFGLLYTSDFDYAYKDIRIKLPLLVLPLVISTSEPLSIRTKHLVLKFLIAAITFSTLVSTLILTDVIHRQIADVRYVSIFISHVRLSLLICIAIFTCIYFFTHSEERKWRWIFAGIAAWLFSYLILVESMTGMSALFITAIAFCLYKGIRSERTVLKYTVLLGITACFAYTGYVVYSTYQRYSNIDVIDESKLETHTAKGNLYKHDAANGLTENGHYVWIYYSEDELREEWNKRSKLDFDGKDKRGNVLRYTLVRFMTSKDLRKDAEGMQLLSDEEIRVIEKGIANVDYMSSLKGRISEIIWEIQLYEKTGDANGHSITQRFEFWKAATGIIRDNPIFGVGTGDLQTAFAEQYKKNDTSLSNEWRLRSHNQYMSIAAAFGLFGLVWFLFALIYPAIKLKRFSDFLYFTFFIVAMVSFLTEDTLETQVGVTFFAFLNSFLLFSGKEKRIASTLSE
jgi:hypothetical protein